MLDIFGCTKDIGVTINNSAQEFSFDIPKEWEGKYEKVVKDNRTTFYYTGYKINDEFYQEFFSIVVMSKNEFNEEYQKELFLGTKLGEKGDNIFVLFTPLDNAISDEEKIEEFQRLYLSESEIQARFSL